MARPGTSLKSALHSVSDRGGKRTPAWQMVPLLGVAEGKQNSHAIGSSSVGTARCLDDDEAGGLIVRCRQSTKDERQQASVYRICQVTLQLRVAVG